MITNVFTNTSEMSMLYGLSMEQLKEEGLEYGLTSISTPYLLTLGELDYIVYPLFTEDTIDIGLTETRLVPYCKVEIRLTNGVEKKEVTTDEFDRDMLSAICLMTGVGHLKVNDEYWEWEPNTKSMTRTLFKYVGFAAAAVLIAGVAYYAYNRYTKE